MKNDDDLIPYYYGCIVLIIALSGCSGIQPVVETDYAIASGEAEQTITSVKLTSNERMIVDHAINTYTNFIEKWKHEQNIILKSEEFLDDYGLIRYQYIQLSKIIRAKWGNYSVEDQAKLKSYDYAAGVFADSVKQMVSAKMWANAGKTAVSVGLVLLEMAKTL